MKILYEENELRKLTIRINRLEYRINEGSNYLMMEVEKLKIIRDKVKGTERKVILLNKMHYATRRRINRQIKLAMQNYEAINTVQSSIAQWSIAS